MVSVATSVGEIKEDLGRVLAPEHVAAVCRATGLRWRQRCLDPVTTVYVFILQVLHANAPMTQLSRLSGVPFTPSAYCQARQRVPLEALRRLLRETGRPLTPHAAGHGHWRGHRTLLIDGSTCSMPDTVALRRQFGLPPNQRRGCGFPVAHLLLLFDAYSGAILDVRIAPWHTHDLHQTAELFEHLQPGDVLVGDRALCAYAQMAWLFAHEVLVVFRVQQANIVDFRPYRPHGGRGQPSSRWLARLGISDQLVVWYPRGRGDTLSAAQRAEIPPLLIVRELRYRVVQQGFRSRTITLATTLLDPGRYPAVEVARLYRTRWQVETHLHELKCTMGLAIVHSRTVAGVAKEVCVFALVYNLVRARMLQAAQQQRVAVARLSFGDALRSVRVRLHPHGPPTCDPLQILPWRPDRYEPRYRKRRPPPYPRMTRPRAVLRREMRKRTSAA
jgi:hypothetical protein